MKDTIEVILFSLFGLWIIMIPAVMIMKIKYFKTSRRKEFKGMADLFSFLTMEWWIAGLTWAFPLIGQDSNVELDSIRKTTNSRLYIFYLIVLTQLTLVGLLNKIV